MAQTIVVSRYTQFQEVNEPLVNGTELTLRLRGVSCYTAVIYVGVIWLISHVPITLSSSVCLFMWTLRMEYNHGMHDLLNMSLLAVVGWDIPQLHSQGPHEQTYIRCLTMLFSTSTY